MATAEISPKLQASIRYALTDAVEGPAIAYWAEAKDIKRDTEGYVISFKVRDGAPDGEPVRTPNTWVTINARSLLKGRNKLLLDDLDVAQTFAGQFVGHDWNYDATGIDVLIQAVVFGDIVYG